MLTFTNQATLTYRNRTEHSNVTTGQITDALTLQKEALTGTYGPGDSITYLLTLQNTGAAELTGLTITDDLGGYTFNGATIYPLAYVADSLRYFVNGAVQPVPTVTPGAPLTISGISVPAAGRALLIYETNVTGFAPLEEGSAITNTATVSGAVLTAPVTATATVNAAVAPELSITKALSPETVGADRQITYTFTIQNEGNLATAMADALTITDTFDPALSNITVTLDGAPWAQAGNYTYSEITGEFATVPGAITVPAATFQQDPVTGAYTFVPGEAVLTVSGTI